MRILKIRFKNLNSLAGEWEIDLTDPAFVSNGLFAITGPTGAGKSTLLDALCLGLYGQTPRLNKITRSSNELMSRQTSECFSEITFETQAGRFRTHWSQHRSRKKSDGELQTQKHEISDSDTGKILESRLTDVGKKIEQVTGMDFKRFTQSMLLAQGEFAAFLKASPDERAPILEQITGTEIYSSISMRVHERNRAEAEKLEVLQAETSGITLLTEEQENELSVELSQNQNAEKDLSEQLQKTKASLEALDLLQSLQKELEGLSRESEIHSDALASFQPHREKLNAAKKAAELDADYALLSSGRQQQTLEQESLKKEEERLPQAELSLKQSSEALKTAEAAALRAKDFLKTETELLTAVRALDIQLSEKNKTLLHQEKDLKNSELQRTETRNKKTKAADHQAEAEKKLEQIHHYLTLHSTDEALSQELSLITEQVSTLQSASKEISVKKAALQTEQNLLESASRLHEHQKKLFEGSCSELDSALKNSEQAHEALKLHLGDFLLREYRAEYDHLMQERVYLKKISDLEAERKKLEDEKPCPLCGAKDHPFAKGNIPEADEIEKVLKKLSSFIAKAETLETAIKEAEIREKETSEKKNQIEKELIQALHKKENSENNLKRMNEELREAAERFDKLKEELRTKVQPFGITELQGMGTQALLSALNGRLKNWNDYQQKKNELEKICNDLTSQTRQLDGILETLSHSIKEKESTLSSLKQQKRQTEEERFTLYGSKNTAEEEARLASRVSEAEKSEKAARNASDQIRHLAAEIQTRIQTFKDSLARRKPELELLEKNLNTRLLKAGFPDEQTFAANRLSFEERSRLERQAKALDEKQADLLTRKKDRETRLARELEKKTTEASPEELRKILEEQEITLKKINEEMGALKQKLSENNEARKKIQEKQNALEAQKRECLKWEKLCLLIGSSDGKKYRNFAQGLTFEIMVSHANRQLEKMTDRYLLIHDDNLPLDLNVVDNYQAGETRSTKNLSGGESFIVSLALALGLSKMASRKVRVDSLFLDEGFGTLDEDALETALETLSSLQQDRKMIGIISHVPALKERISTQIQVIPLSGGRSTLSGPGCRKAGP